jgi:hypothetical protein
VFLQAKVILLFFQLSLQQVVVMVVKHLQIQRVEAQGTGVLEVVGLGSRGILSL